MHISYCVALLYNTTQLISIGYPALGEIVKFFGDKCNMHKKKTVKSLNFLQSLLSFFQNSPRPISSVVSSGSVSVTGAGMNADIYASSDSPAK